MLVRIRTKEKTHRVDIKNGSEDIMRYIGRILPPDAEYKIRKDPNGKDIDISKQDLVDGVLLYLIIKNDQAEGIDGIEEDLGSIKVVDENCKHGANEMCNKCLPLMPYDRKYMIENNIKHMSFYSYLLSIKEGRTNISCPLEESRFSLDKSCTKHAPYPKGICMECRPKNITMSMQEYRLVDHIEFISSKFVNSFIGKWRKTGKQQFGYLYGKYLRYDGVPLGVRAVVYAIFTPPQIGSEYKIELNEDVDCTGMDCVANCLGLEKVGIIFTDLNPKREGRVAVKRGKDSYFLSGADIIFSAKKAEQK
eukprot:GHVP01050151.1.p1 GENE.GHVP01050151.1~~GHVP01050151.1.p1  ORF type:complete len:307 (+),score=48.95 GHVP01050151.1:104-1024(+)